MQRTTNHDRSISSTCSTAATITKSRRNARSARASGSLRARRRSLARLRSAYFSRAGDLVASYSVTFDAVILHLWAARRSQSHFRLKHAVHVEDLVLVAACISGSARAWKDFIEHFERVLVRRGRDGTEDPAAMVDVRKFLATLRRDALAGRCVLKHYAGTRPLRSWLAEAFAAHKVRSKRSAFVLDPADSCCGEPLRFVRTSG